MDKNTEIKEYVLTNFPLVKDIDGMVSLLNQIHNKLHPLSTHDVFSTPTLIYFCKHPKSAYYTFSIKKKSGKLRTISAPCSILKKAQVCINEILKAYYKPNDFACGFVQGKCIRDGAANHVGKNFVLNIDLKDFFDSIDFYKVKRIFCINPFNLANEKLKVAHFLANLCCFPKEVECMQDGKYILKKVYVTPQGAPTSPMLTNLYCIGLDARLSGLAQRFGAAYTRYADDITFSHSKNIFQTTGDFMYLLRIIIEDDNHLKINEDKTRIQNKYYRQEVTGLIVNKRVNVPRRYISQLRKWLYYWERYGVERATSYFKAEYQQDKGFTKIGNQTMANVIGGKLDYLKMIRGNDDHQYKLLQQRYDVLIDKVTSPKVNYSENTSIEHLLQQLVDAL